MIYRVDVFGDSPQRSLRTEIEEVTGTDPGEIRATRIFLIDANASREQIERASRELLADPKMKGIAARQHHDSASAMTLDLGKRVADRARPGQSPAANKFIRQFEMARAAYHQFGRANELASDGRKSLRAVFANADDGQPAPLCANC